MKESSSDPLRYLVATEKSVARAQQDLEAAIVARKFSVLHTYDLREKLHEKGFQLPGEVRVIELCNAGTAFEVLQTEMAMNLALPCRISIWQQDGKTMIGMLRPSVLLEMLSKEPALRTIAGDVERQMIEMVDAAR